MPLIALVRCSLAQIRRPLTSSFRKKSPVPLQSRKISRPLVNGGLWGLRRNRRSELINPPIQLDRVKPNQVPDTKVGDPIFGHQSAHLSHRNSKRTGHCLYVDQCRETAHLLCLVTLKSMGIVTYVWIIFE
jgi:hypothetical protein